VLTSPRSLATWTHTGDALLLGLSTGDILRSTLPSLSHTSLISAPTPSSVSQLFAIDSTSFLAVYSNPDDIEGEIHIIENGTTYALNPNPCFPDPGFPYKARYQFACIRSYGVHSPMVAIASSTSVDVGIAARYAEGKWEILRPDETASAVLPRYQPDSGDDFDSACLGISIDLTSKEALPALPGEDKPAGPPVPVLCILTDCGQLLEWEVVDKGQVGKEVKGTVESVPKPNAAGRSTSTFGFGATGGQSALPAEQAKSQATALFGALAAANAKAASTPPAAGSGFSFGTPTTTPAAQPQPQPLFGGGKPFATTAPFKSSPLATSQPTNGGNAVALPKPLDFGAGSFKLGGEQGMLPSFGAATQDKAVAVPQGVKPVVAPPAIKAATPLASPKPSTSTPFPPHPEGNSEIIKSYRTIIDDFRAEIAELQSFADEVSTSSSSLSSQPANLESLASQLAAEIKDLEADNAAKAEIRLELTSKLPDLQQKAEYARVLLKSGKNGKEARRLARGLGPEAEEMRSSIRQKKAVGGCDVDVPARLLVI